MIIDWIAIISLFITHEYGHYYLAKKEGKYYGWGLCPTPHIKLTDKFNTRWGYLSGVVGSVLAIPFFLLSEFPIWSIPIFIIAIALLDFLPLFLFHKIPREDITEEHNKLRNRFPLLTKWHIF